LGAFRWNRLSHRLGSAWETRVEKLTRTALWAFRQRHFEDTRSGPVGSCSLTVYLERSRVAGRPFSCGGSVGLWQAGCELMKT
jgi:hypothetical protein